MKKLFFLSSLLLFAVMAQAQGLKITPTLKKGVTKNYEIVTKTQVAGKEITISQEVQYAVVDATADGFLMKETVTSVKSDAGDDPTARLLTAVAEIGNGVVTEIVTDKDGQPKSIRNYDQVKEEMSKGATKIIEEMKKAIPTLEDMMPTEELKKQFMEAATEKELLKSLTVSSSPLALNGKTIATGAQDEYINSQDMKMKRMYFVNGTNKITATATLNLSPDELKQLIIDKVTEMAPDQAEMVKQNIDAVLASGMMKFEGTEKANYELNPDGWMKTITVESDTNAMGQQIKANTTVTLK